MFRVKEWCWEPCHPSWSDILWGWSCVDPLQATTVDVSYWLQQQIQRMCFFTFHPIFWFLSLLNFSFAMFPKPFSGWYKWLVWGWALIHVLVLTSWAEMSHIIQHSSLQRRDFWLRIGVTFVYGYKHTYLKSRLMAYEFN